MNIGGDPEQDHFVDGVTESLTTDLSRIRNSFVIARNTAFSYKGKPLDIKQIGGELNVRYVLEGSVQRGGNRMRVNVQLIDTETGNHLWAERFDKPLADLFDMQDEIVARLANQMGTQLVTAEARRAEQAVDPDSMDLYFRAQAVLHGGINATNFAEGKGLFERSIAFDPSNVDALVGFTFFLMFATATGTGGDRMELFRAATAAATKGTALAPDFAPAHAALGYV
jgi:TolB-like protein